MKFLDGKAATAEIKTFISASKKARIAVAFWGAGATEELGFDRESGDVTVICNLMSGGTNPKEIRRLRKHDVVVRQCDTLHGKVYLFDDETVIIGSSNASANGLAFQGKELVG
jgi:hypothetical protein